MNIKCSNKIVYKKLKDIFFILLIIFISESLAVVVFIVFDLLFRTEHIIADYYRKDIWTFLWDILVRWWDVISWT